METGKKIRNAMDSGLRICQIVLFGAMVMVGTYQILVRYLFNRPSTVSEELLTYAFAWLSLLGAAYMFGRQGHMRMGFLADKLTGKKRLALEVVIAALILAFAVIVLIFGGIRIMNLTMTQVTASLGIPMGTVYTVVPLSGALIVIYTVLNIIDLCAGRIELGDTEEAQE